MSLHKETISLFILAILIGSSVAKAQNDCSATLEEWKPIGLEQYSGSIEDIAVHPDKSNVLFAATSQHLLKTGNCGNTWDTLRSAGSGFSKVMFHPAHSDTILAISDRIESSTDGGSSWQRIDSGISYGESGNVEDLAVPEKHPERIYAVLTGSESTNFYKTTDFGATWNASQDSTDLLGNKGLNSVAVFNEYEPDRVLVSTDDFQVLVSEDGADNWGKTSLNSSRNRIEYVSDGSLGIWISIRQKGLMKVGYNYKDSLKKHTEEIPDSVEGINKILNTSMGMGEGVVLSSSDGVRTLRVMVPANSAEENTLWENQNSGLPHIYLSDMESGRFNYIFTALEDTLDSNGVFIRHKPVFTDIKEEKTNHPEQIKLSSNFPNPFNPTTRIGFNLQQASEVSLSVYDMLGRKVETLVDGMYKAGSHSVTFDASRLSSGMYIYRLQTESTTRSRKMMLVK